jgi:ribosomal protein S27AE
MSGVVLVTTRTCSMCGTGGVVSMPADAYERWAGGEAVQTAWPEGSPGERELLITGTHPACWAALTRGLGDD